jgi:hypothetical protein
MPEREQRQWMRSGYFGRRRIERQWIERTTGPPEGGGGGGGGGGGPDEPPEGGEPPYVPDTFNPVYEALYATNPGVHGLTPEEDEYSRKLFERGFIRRGIGSKVYRDMWFDFTGMDPRDFDWEAWRREAGS